MSKIEFVLMLSIFSMYDKASIKLLSFLFFVQYKELLLFCKTTKEFYSFLHFKKIN